MRRTMRIAGWSLGLVMLASSTAAAQTQDPPPGYAEPPPGYAEPPPAQQQPQSAQQQPAPQQQYAAQGSYQAAPPPPSEPEGRGFEMPPFSVRLDPFNWLLYGRLGLELEVGVWEFISFELVPEFVTTSEPFAFDLGASPEKVTQHSEGLGAMSGASFGAGFWLTGKPFQSYVLRVILTNTSYEYRVSDDVGVIDRAEHTERRFIAMLGSVSRIGLFTIGGGIGIGYELNQENRCITSGAGGFTASSDCDDDTFQVAGDRNGDTGLDLYGFLYPYSLEARFSLGITID